MASQHRRAKGAFLSKVTDIDEILPRSQTVSSQITLDPQTVSQLQHRHKLSESPSPMSAYAGSTHSQSYNSSNSPPPPGGLSYSREYSSSLPETSCSLLTLAPESTAVGATSPTSTGFTESSSNKDFGFTEGVRSNESASYPSTPELESPGDVGVMDRKSDVASSQGTVTHRPRPFSRKSKAGTQHTVTPSAAGPEGGFVCKFEVHGKKCGQSFKLPSDIRFVLV